MESQKKLNKLVFNCSIYTGNESSKGNLGVRSLPNTEQTHRIVYFNEGYLDFTGCPLSQHVCEVCGQTIPSTKDIPGPSRRK